MILKSNNKTALILIFLAVITHYADFLLGIDASNSISVGLLTCGTTLLNLNVKREDL
jgi:hypothetical protein